MKRFWMNFTPMKFWSVLLLPSLFLMLSVSGTGVFQSLCFADEAPVFQPNDPNFHDGTDSERMEKALANAPSHGGVVRITRRVPKQGEDRAFWLIDRAILLPADTTLILDNCTVKLSDACRDNFIRSANCGIGIAKPEVIRNVHIQGIGEAVLQGADHPRATGDSVKVLGVRTYGTDAGKEGESQKGDWRNIGVLLAFVEDFSITGITIRESHCWAISLEKCKRGKIKNLSFYSTERRVIDGKSVMTLNQDGLDLRKGCSDIEIDTIQGHTGDDLLALTAIGTKIRPGGLLETTEVSGTESLGPHNDIQNISIRNVSGYSHGGHQIVRILNASGIRIHHVSIDGVTDTSPAGVTDRATLKIGDVVAAWGGPTPLGDTYALDIKNVQTKSHYGVVILGSLCDSSISNVVNRNPKINGVTFVSDGKNYDDPEKAPNARNVKVTGVQNVQDAK